MPPRHQAFAPGEYYHVFNRGALRQTLYHRSDLYFAFLDYARRYAELYKISIVAICLMPNHFHMILKVEDGGDLSMFMCRLCHSYSIRSNLVLDRKGTAFEGRFKAKLVTDDVYFRRLCLYVHANPVKGGLVEHPIKWQYSSYASTLSASPASLYADEALINEFGSKEEFETELMDYCVSQKPEKHQVFVKDLGEMGLL